MISRVKAEPKYTPGPYNYRFIEDLVGKWSIYSEQFAVDSPGYWIADITYWDEGDGVDRAKCEADARLLAAAPELLDALVAMLQVTSLVPNECRGGPFSSAVLAAKAIIQKAIGQD